MDGTHPWLFWYYYHYWRRAAPAFAPIPDLTWTHHYLSQKLQENFAIEIYNGNNNNQKSTVNLHYKECQETLRKDRNDRLSFKMISMNGISWWVCYIEVFGLKPRTGDHVFTVEFYSSWNICPCVCQTPIGFSRQVSLVEKLACTLLHGCGSSRNLERRLRLGASILVNG